jgi:hypothetical protein
LFASSPLFSSPINRTLNRLWGELKEKAQAEKRKIKTSEIDEIALKSGTLSGLFLFLLCSSPLNTQFGLWSLFVAFFVSHPRKMDDFLKQEEHEETQ